MPTQWFFQVDGVEQGPVDAAEIRRLVAAGSIVPTTPVRKSDMTAWVKASAIKGLFPAPAIAAVTEQAVPVVPLPAVPPGKPKASPLKMVAAVLAFIVAYAVSYVLFHNLGAWMGGH
jgi:hypothetical protein